eukprot:12006762-Ditylum_brightwellii.AAC.1
MEETPGAYILLTDKTHIPVLGKGTAIINFLGKVVYVPDCFYVLALCAPLYSIHHHWHHQGCSFLADNKGYVLTFPLFTVDIDDTSDCLISIAPA